MATPEESANSQGNRTWVKFDDDASGNSLKSSQEANTAIIEAETTQVNFENNKSEPKISSPLEDKTAAVITPESVHINVGRPSVNRSAHVEIQNSSSVGSKSNDNKGPLKNIDLRDNANGRSNSLASTGLANVGNAIIRQGFGTLNFSF